MATFEASLAAFPSIMEVVKAPTAERYKEVFQQNRDRIYSLAFWLTDNELTAEEISVRVFSRAFASPTEPKSERIDRILISELRDIAPIGVLTLAAEPTADRNVRANQQRVLLERAVVQVPATERLAFLLHDVEGYDHARVARTLGITEQESRRAVMQAKILIRELMAQMS